MNNHLNTPLFSASTEQGSHQHATRNEKLVQENNFSQDLHTLRQNTGTHFSKSNPQEQVQTARTAIKELSHTTQSTQQFAQAVHFSPEFFMSTLKNAGKSVSGAAALEEKLSQVQA